MITPMTKLTMFIYHRDYKQFLVELRDHGVVHVHAKKQTLQDEVMKAKMTEVKHISNTIKLLDTETQRHRDTKNDGLCDSATLRLCDLNKAELIAFIDGKFAEIDSIQQQIASLQKEDGVYNLWGEFPEEQIKQIQNNNWDLRFFSRAVRQLTMCSYPSAVEVWHRASVVSSSRCHLRPRLSALSLRAQPV